MVETRTIVAAHRVLTVPISIVLVLSVVDGITHGTGDTSYMFVPHLRYNSHNKVNDSRHAERERYERTAIFSQSSSLFHVCSCFWLIVAMGSSVLVLAIF